jgi:hypothetical protein
MTSELVKKGEITEIVGGLSSGRTSLLTACLRDVTRSGAVAALVDTDHAFDPPSATRAGIDLAQVLWVRCGGRRDAALRATDVLVRCRGFALIVLDSGETPPRLPLTAAFRLKLAVRKSEVALLLLGRRRIAGPGATIAVECVPDACTWSGPAAMPTRLASLRSRLWVLRGPGLSPPAREWIA